MVSITGFNAARSQEIEDASIIGGTVVGGDLILTRHDGGEVNAGDIRGGEQIPHSNIVQVTSTGSTTSSTFSNFASSLAVASFVKYRDDTKLHVEFTGGIYTPDTFTQYEVAIYIDSVNRIVVNDFGASGGKAGMMQITGLAAGTYTCTARKRRVTGSGTVYEAHAGGKSSLKITETF